MESVAEAIGGRLKPRFGNRYRAFQKRLLAYNEDENTELDGSGSQIGKAISLLRNGDIDEANRLENQTFSGTPCACFVSNP